MNQDEFALVVDVKTRPGMEAEYERLMMEVAKRQAAEASYVGTSVHRDSEGPTHFVIYEVWRDARISRRSKNSAIIESRISKASTDCSPGRAK